MSTFSQHRKTANEQSVEELQAETRQWDKLLRVATEEIQFLRQFISADVFDTQLPNLYEKLKYYSDQLEELKSQKMELHVKLRNHQNDLNGMMECEDISCDAFYHAEHRSLSEILFQHLQNFQELKLNIFKFSTPLLRSQH